MSKQTHPGRGTRMPTYAIRRTSSRDFVRPAARAKGPDDDIEITHASEAERVTPVTKDLTAKGGKVITATERLYRTASGRIVGKSDPDRLTLVALPGQQVWVPDVPAPQYGPLRPRHGRSRQ
jgi:hypothetical protein